MDMKSGFLLRDKNEILKKEFGCKQDEVNEQISYYFVIHCWDNEI
jgi:hypothetical protein